ncbi:MAG: SDR family oxidoreductase [Rhodobiaceae bacterium]|nr:SDR family oxidoreductase [Rhodobiaceae bacterium]MCC0048163.1 SDR family oxidoreductase [Rhodobiaceae bacterium]
MPTQFDLTGRKAIVTGGAQGIGRAVAERFIASGAEVALWDVDTVLAGKTAEEIGAVAVRADVSNPESVTAALTETLMQLGRIDIAVNNAGITGPNTTTWTYPPEEWDRVMAINLTGPFLVCRAVAPIMIEHGYGRIVNVASIAGKEGNPNAVAYSSSKAGVIALTKSLGKELAGHDIAVNCITPAAAKTAIFEQMTQEHIDYMLSKIPRGRFVLVEEIAALVTFLASAENSFTTGGVFDISGGRATY